MCECVYGRGEWVALWFDLTFVWKNGEQILVESCLRFKESSSFPVVD